MARCHVCGSPADENGAAYRCSYCDEVVCERHRLPENHACTGTRNEERADESDGPQSADFYEANLPGTTPRRQRRRTDSGPDVDPDGSLSEGDATGESDSASERSLFERIRDFLFG